MKATCEHSKCPIRIYFELATMVTAGGFAMTQRLLLRVATVAKQPALAVTSVTFRLREERDNAAGRDGGVRVDVL